VAFKDVRAELRVARAREARENRPRGGRGSWLPAPKGAIATVSAAGSTRAWRRSGSRSRRRYRRNKHARRRPSAKRSASRISWRALRGFTPHASAVGERPTCSSGSGVAFTGSSRISAGSSCGTGSRVFFMTVKTFCSPIKTANAIIKTPSTVVMNRP